LESLKNIYNGIDTFAKLEAGNAKNPKDVAVAFKLARKYETDRWDYKKAFELYKSVIDRPSIAKKMLVDYTEMGVKISVYEWALYQAGRLYISDLEMGYPTSGSFSNVIQEVGGVFVQQPIPVTTSETEGKKDNFLYFKKLVDEYPDSKFGKTVYSELAINYSGSGKPEEAEPFFEKMLKRFPDDTELLEDYVAYCIRTKSNLDKGIQTAQKILSSYGNLLTRENVNRLYAQLFYLKGDTTAANEIYGPTYANRLVSELQTPLINYIRYWIVKGDNDKGINQAINTLISIDETGNWRQSIARFSISANKQEKALAIYGPEYISQIKGNPTELLRYAQFWSSQDSNGESALAALEQYKNLRTIQLSQSSIMSMEIIYKRLGKTEESKKLGAEYIELNKNNADNLSGYALQSTMTGGNLDNGLKAATMATEIEPGNYRYWDALSQVYFKMQNYPKALETGEKALSLATTDTIKNSIKTRLDAIKKEMEKKG